MNNNEAHDQLLADARRRGVETLGTAVVPQGFDNFTTYIGLIASALELGKLVATEERDLTAIGNHHEREMARIGSAFAEIETAMKADFARDASLREQTFQVINSLVAAGQHEIAMNFFETLMNNFTRPALETVLKARNEFASASGTRITLR